MRPIFQKFGKHWERREHSVVVSNGRSQRTFPHLERNQSDIHCPQSYLISVLYHLKKWQLSYVITHLIKYLLALTNYWVNQKIIHSTPLWCHKCHLLPIYVTLITSVTCATSIYCVICEICFTCVQPLTHESPNSPVSSVTKWFSGDHGQDSRRRRVCLYWGRLEVCCHGGMTPNI